MNMHLFLPKLATLLSLLTTLLAALSTAYAVTPLSDEDQWAMLSTGSSAASLLKQGTTLLHPHRHILNQVETRLLLNTRSQLLNHVVEQRRTDDNKQVQRTSDIQTDASMKHENIGNELVMKRLEELRSEQKELITAQLYLSEQKHQAADCRSKCAALVPEDFDQCLPLESCLQCVRGCGHQLNKFEDCFAHRCKHTCPQACKKPICLEECKATELLVQTGSHTIRKRSKLIAEVNKHVQKKLQKTMLKRKKIMLEKRVDLQARIFDHDDKWVEPSLTKKQLVLRARKSALNTKHSTVLRVDEARKARLKKHLEANFLTAKENASLRIGKIRLAHKLYMLEKKYLQQRKKQLENMLAEQTKLRDAQKLLLKTKAQLDTCHARCGTMPASSLGVNAHCELPRCQKCMHACEGGFAACFTQRCGDACSPDCKQVLCHAECSATSSLIQNARVMIMKRNDAITEVNSKVARQLERRTLLQKKAALEKRLAQQRVLVAARNRRVLQSVEKQRLVEKQVAVQLQHLEEQKLQEALTKKKQEWLEKKFLAGPNKLGLLTQDWRLVPKKKKLAKELFLLEKAYLLKRKKQLEQRLSKQKGLFAIQQRVISDMENSNGMVPEASVKAPN